MGSRVGSKVDTRGSRVDSRVRQRVKVVICSFKVYVPFLLFPCHSTLY